jgi:hypothetical protein
MSDHLRELYVLRGSRDFCVAGEILRSLRSLILTARAEARA